MISQNHNIDPVIRDLNNYLAESDTHDIKMEAIQAKAEKEFYELNYLEIIQYGDNYDYLEMLFEYVLKRKIEESERALNMFIETVKESFIKNRIDEIEEEEQKERENDQAFEKYYAENPPYWC